MRIVHANSTSPSAIASLEGRYDSVFIDGDHGYRAARSDWMLALSPGARFIGFHDIVDSHWHVAARCCVSRLWAELRGEYRTEERTLGDWAGIGVVWPGAA
jgi:hypothetical protein